MPQNDSVLATAINLLAHPHSEKRRSGAKRLRKLQAGEAGPALLTALQHEMRDPRTWETQYQMIMALGVCDYRPALPYLQTLAPQSFTTTAVYLALGDAIVRLGRAYPDDPAPIFQILEQENENLTYGAFQAMAMLHMKLDGAAVHRLLTYLDQHNPTDPASFRGALRFPVAIAAAGWEGSAVAAFLHACLASPREDVKRAATAALQKKYERMYPL